MFQAFLKKTVLIQEVWFDFQNIKDFEKNIPFGATDTVFVVADSTLCNTKFFSQVLLSKTGLFSGLAEPTCKDTKITSIK